MLKGVKIANAAELKLVVFKDKATAPLGKKFVSLFPGLGYAAGYKVGQALKLKGRMCILKALW
jgi:hypothetical protein